MLSDEVEIEFTASIESMYTIKDSHFSSDAFELILSSDKKKAHVSVSLECP